MDAAKLESAGVRAGPAARDYAGHLPARELARLRTMLDLGLENVDIAEEMSLNRSAVMYHRRIHDEELTAAGKPATRPVREGRIPGRPITPDQSERLRALLAAGVSSGRAAIALEVSRPCATRHRAALVRELAARGETIPGCDLAGRPIGARSANAVGDAKLGEIRRRLLVPERIPAIASATGVSAVTVRRVWRQFRRTLGETPLCPCGREAHHAQRCRPTSGGGQEGRSSDVRRLVEAAVPRHHDSALRADIVQDVTLAILASPKPPSDIAAFVREAVASNYRRFANRWGDLSLDAPIGDGEGTLLDVLAATTAAP